MNKKPFPAYHSAIELCIAQERLRQARYSFNLAQVAITASFFIGLTGAGLLLSNKLPEGSVIAAGGLVSSVRCIQFAKDANDRLDKILTELNDKDQVG
ncbi:TRADD-N-associated membrane domain-containing protein [Nostoc sp. CALU 546]|uniref:TRADD-N-associated membrane domain-containing protein n=1 Tax=Nostoc sp. CALU 546 TaxID=1867241 RepID=UPI003B66DCD9